MRISRRNALKAIFVLISVVLSYLFIHKWINIFATPDLSVLHKKKRLIAEIAEIIIPRTDTPGAKDAKVEDFIIGIIEFCSDVKTQNNFLNGLRNLERYATDNYQHAFLECTQNEKITILNYLENSSKFRYNILNKIYNKILGKPFIFKFKELTVEGYCTSKLGATEGLAYDYIPVFYEPCITLEKNQKAWATK